MKLQTSVDSEFEKRLGIPIQFWEHIDALMKTLDNTAGILEAKLLKELIASYWMLCYKYKFNRYITKGERNKAKAACIRFEQLYLEVTEKVRLTSEHRNVPLPSPPPIVTSDLYEARLLEELSIPVQATAVDELDSLASALTEEEEREIIQREWDEGQIEALPEPTPILTADKFEAILLSSLSIHFRLLTEEELIHAE